MPATVDLQQLEAELRKKLSGEIMTLREGLVKALDYYGADQIRDTVNIFSVRVDGVIDSVIHNRVGA